MARNPLSRAALVVGTNYSGANKLNGCVNDANDMAGLLRFQFGVKPENLKLLLDKQATRANIVRAIIDASRLGPDYFHVIFSGHGTWVGDTSGDEGDWRDEAFVPHDYANAGYLVDDELALLWRLFPKNTRIFCHFDTCHSGTLARSFTSNGWSAFRTWWRGEKARYISPLDMPAEKRLELFNRTLNELRATRAMPATQQPLQCEVLSISGCTDAQTSADARIDGRYCGAMTNAFLQAVRKSPGGTYRAIHAEMLRILKAGKFSQTPVLTVVDEKNSILDERLYY